MRVDHFHGLFDKQYGDLPAGGFLNPEIVDEFGSQIIFWCHYEGYESEADSWYYGFDLKSREFYAA